MALMVVKFCVDLDNYTTKAKFKKIVDSSRERCSKFGEIYHDKKTRNGWHIKVKLKKKTPFWRSIEIRNVCGDDPKRMFYDIMRWRAGSSVVDLCFDRKTTTITLNKKKKRITYDKSL